MESSVPPVEATLPSGTGTCTSFNVAKALFNHLLHSFVNIYIHIYILYCV